MKNKNPRVSVQLLASLAMLIALTLIVEKFSITIIPKQLVVAFTFIVHTVIGMIGGPLWGFVSLFLIDIVDMLTKGGADFIIWWTLMEAVQGALYGFFFYGKKLDWNNKKDWVHVTVAMAVILLFGIFIFTPLLIQIYFGVPFVAQFIAGRWLKIFELPIRVFTTMALLPQLQRIPEVRKLAGIKK